MALTMPDDLDNSSIRLKILWRHQTLCFHLYRRRQYLDRNIYYQTTASDCPTLSVLQSNIKMIFLYSCREISFGPQKKPRNKCTLRNTAKGPWECFQKLIHYVL